MALLPDADRSEVDGDYQREVSALLEALPGVLKLEVRAAVNATDQWISDNDASFVAALPQPFRSQSTKTQKVRLFKFVLDKRFGTGV